MGRYGLSRIQLSHAGFNPLKHPWEVLGRVDFPRGVKVLMRGLSPTINPNLRYCQTCIHGSINTRSLPLSEIAHPVKLHMCQHVKLFGKRNAFGIHTCSVFPRKRSFRCDVIQLSHPRLCLFLQTGICDKSNSIFCKQHRDAF